MNEYVVRASELRAGDVIVVRGIMRTVSKILDQELKPDTVKGPAIGLRLRGSFGANTWVDPDAAYSLITSNRPWVAIDHEGNRRY